MSARARNEINEILRNMPAEQRANFEDIDTSKIAKLVFSHELIEQILDLPPDVRITSMHTTRGETETGVYMICNRFESVPPGGTAPILTRSEIDNMGLWDTEAN